MSKLFRKDEKFFKIFGQMTVYILEAAEILGNMLRNPAADVAPLAAKIKDLEHKGDELTHRVIDELNKTFITPIDREDIHDLSAALDDVLDLIDNTATRIVLFRITEPIRDVPEMCAVLLSQAMELAPRYQTCRIMITLWSAALRLTGWRMMPTVSSSQPSLHSSMR